MTTTPVDDVVEAAHAYHRDLVSERTRAALALRRQWGVRLGRPVQLPESVRHRIRDERAAGRSLSAIGRGLDADGVPTSQGGARWYPATVRAVLRSIAIDEKGHP